MKKMSLSAAVILAFLIYSFHEQQEAAGVQVTPPQTLPNSNSSTNSSSGVSSDNSPSSASNPPADNNSGTNTGSTANTSTQTTGQYKDGEYTGSVADAFYGPIQVKAIIQNGKISDVQFLQYPNDRGTSVMINRQAMPYLTQEAIQAQSANVDIVTGATDSSQAFRESLDSALSQAKG